MSGMDAIPSTHSRARCQAESVVATTDRHGVSLLVLAEAARRGEVARETVVRAEGIDVRRN